MRIGELLIEAGIINPKQLSAGLEYAKAKGLPIGRVLILLRFLREAYLRPVLEIQKLIRTGGLPCEIGIKALRLISAKEDISLAEAIRQSTQNVHGPSTMLTAETIAPVCSVKLDDPSNAVELLKQGDLALNEDKYVEAEGYYKRALAIVEELSGSADMEIIPALQKLSNLYLVFEKFSYAEIYYQRIVEIKKQALGAEHADLAKSLEDLADLYQACQEDHKAQQFYLAAQDIREKLLPEGQKDYADNLKRAILLLRKNSQKQERKLLGELLIESSLLTTQQFQKSLQNSKRLGIPLGQVLKDFGFVSEQQLQSALKAQIFIKENVLPSSLAAKALRLSALQQISLEAFLHAIGLLTENDLGTAGHYRKLALAIDELLALENSLGAEHAEVATAANKLADLYEQASYILDAEILYKRALSIWSKSSEFYGAELAATSSQLAKLYLGLKKYPEAEPLLLRTLEIKQKMLGFENLDIASALEQIGELQYHQGNFQACLNFYQSALSIKEKLLGSEHLDLASTMEGMANCCVNMELYDQAKSFYLRLLTTKEKTFGRVDPEVASLLDKLGDIYRKQGQLSQAEAQYNFALQILERTLDPGHQAISEVLSKLASLSSK